MFTINIPSTVKTILEKLNENYDAYVVGGCVRDAVLRKEPKDWDITTNALPEQIKKVFENYPIINNNGEKHGTITVHIGDENYEITTYRIDGDYSDGRHPDKVTFTADLKDDLARRDFTINAMAADINGELIDPFEGQKDLLHGILRCVGDPNKRFDEDALRILRGLRFASVLNLVIDRDTLDAMFRAKHNLDKISKERIFTEIKKMVIGDSFTKIIRNTYCFQIICSIIPELSGIWDYQQHSRYHKHDYLLEHTLSVVDNVSNNYIVKLAALFHDIGKPYVCIEDEYNPSIHHFVNHAEKSAEITEYILTNLKASNIEKEKIIFLVKNHDFSFSIRRLTKSVKKFIPLIPEKYRDELFDSFLELRKADRVDHVYFAPIVDLNEVKKEYNQLINTKTCLDVKQLAIKGNDIVDIIGKPGPLVGKLLDICLSAVIEEELSNDKTSLLEFVRNYYGQQNE